MLFKRHSLLLTVVGNVKLNGTMEDVAPRCLDNVCTDQDMENEEDWCCLFESLLGFSLSCN